MLHNRNGLPAIRGAFCAGVIKMAKLTAKRQIFAEEYLTDLNGTRAYRTAYPSVKSDQAAAAGASRLLRNAKVAEYIQMRRQALQERTEITQERVLKELGRLALFDAKKMFDADGNPIRITELDDDTAACIVGLDVFEEYDGCGEDRVLAGHIKKYKIADKKGALELLGRHFGMFNDSLRISGDLDIKVAVDYGDHGGEQ
jgi:phage terminase small subunit